MASSKADTGRLRVGYYIVRNYKLMYPEIDSGTFGTIHKAKLKDETVVVKRIRTSGVNQEYTERFRLEHTFLKKLQDHKNIVTYKDYFQEKDAIYIIMEYCELGNMRNYFASKVRR